MKMDQHMQQLAAEGVNDAPNIINRMMGYTPDLHQIWVGTTDAQLIALTEEFPGFYRYAHIMEEASEAERKKASRPYDDLAEFPEKHKEQASRLLVMAATLERGYQAFIGSGRLKFFEPQVRELGKLYRKWLSDVEGFKSALRAQGADPRGLEYVDKAFGQLAERIQKLAA